MNKKAQTAVEFLTTYGWVILGVIILLAILTYYGAFNPLRFAPRQCTFEPGLPCTTNKLEVNQTTIRLITQLSNDLGYDIAFGNNAILLYTENIGKPGKQTYLGNCSPRLPYVIKKGGTFTCIVEITDKEVIPEVGKNIKLQTQLIYKNCLTDPNYLATGNCTLASNYTSTGTEVTPMESYSKTLYCGDGICSASIGENPSTCPMDCPPPASIILTANPATVAPDGNSYSTITAVVRNKDGQLMQNMEVVFTSQIGKFSSYTAVTDISGRARVNITSTQAGVATITGVAPPLSNTTTVKFYYVPSTLLLTAAPPQPCTNSSQITATVMDQNGNLIRDMELTLSHNATGIASFNPYFVSTNDTGTAATIFFDSKLHSERVRLNATLYIFELGINLTNSMVLDYTPASITLTSRYPFSCGKVNYSITAHVVDKYNNVICGYDVGFYHNSTGVASFTPPTNRTNSTGDTSTLFYGNIAENVTLEARATLSNGQTVSGYTTVQYGGPIYLSDWLVDQDLTCQDVEIHVSRCLNITEAGRLTFKGVHLIFDFGGIAERYCGSFHPSGIYLQGSFYVTDSHGSPSILTINRTRADCCRNEPPCCATPDERPADCDLDDPTAPCYDCLVQCPYGVVGYDFQALPGSHLTIENAQLEYVGSVFGSEAPNDDGLYIATDNAVVRNTSISNARFRGIVTRYANNVTITGNEISNTFSCLEIMDTTNSIFSNNDIHNCEGEGISLEGDTGNTIRDNYVHDNPRTAENPEFDPSGIGIGVGSGSTWENPHTDNNRIINNTVVRNHRGIIAGGQRYSNLISNYIANNDYAGVIVGTDGDADLSNNQIVNNSGFGVKCEGGSDMDVTFSGNMISGNGNNCDSCPNCLEPRSTCGTITKSTQLTSDLVNDSTCITFGADNITLDCQGHSISWCCSGFPGEYYAIYANGKNNIEVKNCVLRGYPGSIAGYSDAVYLQFTNNSKIHSNVIHSFTGIGSLGYAGAILLKNSNGNSIYNNTLFNQSGTVHMFLVSSQNNSIQDNTMYNGTSGSVTIGDESDGNSILRNTIRNSNGGISLRSSSYNRMESNSISNNKRGIYLQSFSNSNMILSNRISNVSDPYGEGAVGLVDSSNNTVRNNTIYNTTFYGINILDASYKNFIFNNTITKTFTGINMSTSAGLCNNTISNTTISNTTYGVYLDMPYNASIVNSTITNNVYGIYSSYAMSNSLIRNNNISSNTNTGVYIKDSDLNFSLNTVTLNGQYGVFCNTTFLKPTFSGNTISGNGNNCDGCTGCP